MKDGDDGEKTRMFTGWGMQINHQQVKMYLT